MRTFEFGDVITDFPPHPLIPEGVSMHPDDILIVTPWDDLLPGVDFSRQRFADLARLTTDPNILNHPDTVLMAEYLLPKLVFDEETGCWKLPLKAERDANGSGRYPTICVSELGYKNQVAHRATVEVFMGQELPKDDRTVVVDHRCRNHACCNPYHLDVVGIGENTARGRRAAKNIRAPHLFQSVVSDIVMVSSLTQSTAVSNG